MLEKTIVKGGRSLKEGEYLGALAWSWGCFILC